MDLRCVRCATLERAGAVTGDKSMSQMERIRKTYATSGIKGFYPGGVPLAFRQMTNWASRQGFTEYVRGVIKTQRYPTNPKAQLTGTHSAIESHPGLS